MTLILPGAAIPKLRNDAVTEPIVESTGNVFADLGFDSGDTANLQMRAKLMADLRKHIRASGMTQTEAVERLGIT